MPVRAPEIEPEASPASKNEAWASNDEAVQKTNSALSTPTDGRALKRGLTLTEAAEVPIVCNSVPMSSYGAVMMLPGLIETPTFCEWYHQLGEAYMRLIINYAAQGVTTAMLYTMYLQEEATLLNGPPDCEKLELSLEVVCLWLHVIACLTDICETWNMSDILWKQIPTVVGATEVLRYVQIDGSQVLNSGGFSLVRKVFVTVFILLPKFIIAVLVLVLGGMYVAASQTNSDVLMNCLALTFIIGIDEMIFDFLAPARTRHLIEAIPSFESNDDTFSLRFFRHFGTSMRVVVSLATVCIIRVSVRHCGEPGVFDAPSE